MAQYQNSPDQEKGRFGSHWAVLARSEGALAALSADKRWQQLKARDEHAWTDDFSNIWSVIHWRQR